MRPLVCTSGNVRAHQIVPCGRRGFNEAAGLHQRKRGHGVAQHHRHPERFNEAAGLHQRKPFRELAKDRERIIASMRPLVCTSGNTPRPRRSSRAAIPRFNEAAGLHQRKPDLIAELAALGLASMRPLVCTSGNHERRAVPPGGVRHASMRPLVCTSGNSEEVRRAYEVLLASMRPLVCTSGNALRARHLRAPVHQASMRPLVCTSGNLRKVRCASFLTALLQ